MNALQGHDGYEYYLSREGRLDTLPPLEPGERLHLLERCCRVPVDDGLCLEKFKSTGALATHMKMDHPKGTFTPAEQTGNPSKKRRLEAKQFYNQARKDHIAKHPQRALPPAEFVRNLMVTSSSSSSPPAAVPALQQVNGKLEFPLYKRSNKKQGIKKGKANWNAADHIIKSQNLGEVPCEICKPQCQKGERGCRWQPDCLSFAFFTLPPADSNEEESAGEENGEDGE